MKLANPLGFLLVALSVVTFAAMAQTPDGETPAQEGICDPLKADGVTKGLYGLCVAFCEAHDAADVTFPLSEEELQALADSKPNGKLLEAYNKKKGENDPYMPCVVEGGCPCYNSETLGVIATSATNYSTTGLGTFGTLYILFSTSSISCGSGVACAGYSDGLETVTNGASMCVARLPDDNNSISHFGLSEGEYRACKSTFNGFLSGQ